MGCMVRRARHHADPRRLLVARLTGIAAGYAGGLRAEFTRDDALAELRAVTTDPDVLAEAAAMYVGDDYWYGGEAVALLIDAGADPAAIPRHAEQRARSTGFDLRRLANGLNHE
jgi:hypothetical protein